MYICVCVHVLIGLKVHLHAKYTNKSVNMCTLIIKKKCFHFNTPLNLFTPKNIKKQKFCLYNIFLEPIHKY